MKIIVIDDNPAIHQDFIKILVANKNQYANANMHNLEQAIFGETKEESILPEFDIDTALQGKEGFEKVKRAYDKGDPYALAFVDIRMPPGWDGVETIKNIWSVDPHIQIVICSAYSDYSWEDTVKHLGQSDNLLILRKPFDNVTIRQIACALSKKWQLLKESQSYTSELETRVNQRTESLEKSLSLMRATMESSADGVLIVNNDKRITDYNEKFLSMWQLPPTLVEAKDFELFSEYLIANIDNPDEFRSRLKKLDKTPNETVSGILRFKNGRVFEFYSQGYTLNDIMIGRVWSFRDITKRVSLEEELQYQATHDPLTDLPNRILLLDRIRQSMAKSDRYHHSFAVFYLDLDRFKLINDSLTHEAGDEILRAVTGRLLTVLRSEDTLARLGGDEFVIVINDFKNEGDLIAIAQKIVAIFVEPFELYNHRLIMTPSIGVAIYPKDGRHIDMLLRNADTAMYRAKELGGDQFQFYTDDLNKRNLERLENESQLRHAISNNEFFLTYQPQYDLTTGKFVSVEALIRWKHPTKGITLPMDFIPLAEDSGLIVPIGEWVIKTACKQLKSWLDAGLQPIRVAVNVTTKQFRLYNLTQTIRDILAETGLEPKYLELELTENIIINNTDIIKTIKELKELGVQIVLDDFGTGYSSLNYLRQLPIDRLKIDQSYVQNYDSDRGDDVIMQAIIAMAKSLNLDVLAEGVETQKQLDFLKSMKCTEVQGYYFSQPLTAEELETLLKKASELEKEVAT